MAFSTSQEYADNKHTKHLFHCTNSIPGEDWGIPHQIALVTTWQAAKAEQSVIFHSFQPIQKHSTCFSRTRGKTQCLEKPCSIHSTLVTLPLNSLSDIKQTVLQIVNLCIISSFWSQGFLPQGKNKQTNKKSNMHLAKENKNHRK